MKFGAPVEFNRPPASGTITDFLVPVHMYANRYLVFYDNLSQPFDGGQICARLVTLIPTGVSIGPEVNSGALFSQSGSAFLVAVKLDDRRVALFYNAMHASDGLPIGGAVLVAALEADDSISFGSPVGIHKGFGGSGGFSSTSMQDSSFVRVNADRVLAMQVYDTIDGFSPPLLAADKAELILVDFGDLSATVSRRLAFWDSQFVFAGTQLLQANDETNYILFWRRFLGTTDTRYQYVNVTNDNITAPSGTFRNDVPFIPPGASFPFIGNAALGKTPEGLGFAIISTGTAPNTVTTVYTFTLPATVVGVDWSPALIFTRDAPYRMEGGGGDDQRFTTVEVGGADAHKTYFVDVVDTATNTIPFNLEALPFIGLFDPAIEIPFVPFQPTHAPYSPASASRLSPDTHRVAAQGGRGIAVAQAFGQNFAYIFPINPGAELPLRWRQRDDCLTPGTAVPCICLNLPLTTICVPPFWLRITSSVQFGGRVGARNTYY